ncbi:MAG: transcription termination factor NusA [Leptospiraceae bacterium]|nr:transcription termination factor NusA [Leptospiraceae bacterium]MDW7976862.1 transcription termination factor NusA [Leptospiraceae bacterium]
MVAKDVGLANTRSTRNKPTEPNFSKFYEDLKNIALAKNLTLEQTIEILKGSFLSILHKKYGSNANIDIIMDPEKGIFDIYIHYTVVEKVKSPDYEKSLEEARAIDPQAKIGSTITIQESFESFTRYNANEIQTTFHQRLKDLENEYIYSEFITKKGEIVSAQVLSFVGNKDVPVMIGKASGVIPKSEQMPKDRYAPGKIIKAVVKEVMYRKDGKGRVNEPYIILSRGSADFVKALFKQEIPEIQAGIVEILGIVREAGFRTKMIVYSKRSDVDPVGACLGIRGSRIQNIQREIYNEKIDIIPYSENPANMIANALSPAKVSETYLDTDQNEALVIVPDYEYSNAIGVGGKNVRLASQLLGYKINIKTQREYREEMSDPEKKAKLEALFSFPKEDKKKSEEEQEAELTPLTELPGLTKRVIELLKSAGIESVEKLVEVVLDQDLQPKPEVLQKIPGINKTTAEYIIKILLENVEIQQESE